MSTRGRSPVSLVDDPPSADEPHVLERSSGKKRTPPKEPWQMAAKESAESSRTAPSSTGGHEYRFGLAPPPPLTSGEETGQMSRSSLWDSKVSPMSPSTKRQGTVPIGSERASTLTSSESRSRRRRAMSAMSGATKHVRRFRNTRQANWLVEVVLQHWLPLLGALTIVESLLAEQEVLSILEYLLGVSMVHLRMVQEWILFAADSSSVDRRRSSREQFLAGMALILGIVRCILQGRAYLLDYQYLFWCALGIAWARWGRVGRRMPPPKGLHMFPMILLSGSVATLSPPPGLASLPYCMIFLTFMLVSTSGKLSFRGIWMRIILVTLTSFHLLALFVIHFWALVVPDRGPIFEQIVLFFGRVGWNRTFGVDSDPSPMPIHNEGVCAADKDEDRLLVEMHLGALALMHFWLCNVSVEDKKRDDDLGDASEQPSGRATSSPMASPRNGDGQSPQKHLQDAIAGGLPSGEATRSGVDFVSEPPTGSGEETVSPGRGPSQIRNIRWLRNKFDDAWSSERDDVSVMEARTPRRMGSAVTTGSTGREDNWVTMLAKVEPLVALLTYVLNAPSLLTLPLWATACLANPFRSVVRCCRNCCRRRRHDGREMTDNEERFAVARSPFIYWYSMLVFFCTYGTGIVSGGLPDFVRPYADMIRAPSGSWLKNWRPWTDAFGMDATGCDDAVWAIETVVPQAILILCLAINQRGGSICLIVADIIKWVTTSDPRTWQTGGVLELFLHVPTEVSMLAVCMLSLLLVMKEDYSTSVFVLVYFTALTVLLLKEITFAAIKRLFGGDWRRELGKDPGKHSIRWWLWFLIETAAQISPFPIIIVYNLVGSHPDAKLPGVWMEWFFPGRTVTGFSDLQQIILIHLCIQIWANFERWRVGRASELGEDSKQQHALLMKKYWWIGALYEAMDHSVRIILFALSVVVTLLPPTDVHSFVILLVFAPSLLFYQLDKGNAWRAKLLNVVIYVLLAFSALFLYQRVLFACPLVPLPTEHLQNPVLTLEELGVSRRLERPPWKMFFMGITAVLAHFAVKAEKLKQLARDDRKQYKELVKLSAMRSMETSFAANRGMSANSLDNKQNMAQYLTGGKVFSDLAAVTQGGLAAGRGVGHQVATLGNQVMTNAVTGVSAIGKKAHGAVMQVDTAMRGHSNNDAISPSRQFKPPVEHHPFEDALRAVPYRSSVLTHMRAGHVDANAMKANSRFFGSKSILYSLEELFIRYWPDFLPREKHFYASLLLLCAIFVMSVYEGVGEEFSLYNFVMVMGVLCLTAWRSSWIVMGLVFAVLECTCMVVQYMTKFEIWEQTLDVKTSKLVGLYHNGFVQARHCVILLLCILQRQLWHREQRRSFLDTSKRRQGVCPDWLRMHADIVGIFALLFLAAIQHHFWGYCVALMQLPWILGSGQRRLLVSSGARGTLRGAKDALRRCWDNLYKYMFFRLILLTVLVAQISWRFLSAFSNVGTGQTQGNVLKAICREQADRWEDEITCFTEWDAWVTAKTGTEIYSFMILQVLGVVQSLLDNDNVKSRPEAHIHRPQPEKDSFQHWVMLWWPSVVWFCTLIVSLNGGSLVGLTHLVCLIGLTNIESKTRGDMTEDEVAHRRLDSRKRWVWRTRICAWMFFMAGLAVQSPVAPCSVSSCEGFSWMPAQECVRLENLNITEVSTESWMTNECRQMPMPDAIGPDSIWTEMIKLLGFWHTDLKDDGWSSAFVILTMQHGWLLLLIFACTIQLRIYSSESFQKNVWRTLVVQPEDVLRARAARQVLEFHLRHKLEARNGWYRQQALKKKLQRTMRGIRDMLDHLQQEKGDGGIVRKSEGVCCPACQMQGIKGDQDESKQKKEKRLRTTEAVQVSHGVAESVAKDVTRMFHNNVSAAKKYLSMMQQVAIGRLQERGSDIARMEKRLKHLSEMSKVGEPTAANGERSHVTDDEPDEERKTFTARLRQVSAFASSVLERVKASTRFSNMMVQCDFAFLGMDEKQLLLRPTEEVAEEEMDRHRRHNGPLRLAWKLALANTQLLVGIVHVFAFVFTPSILEALRLLVVLFGALCVYPFPGHMIWTGLFRLGVALIFIRTVYNLPIFCPITDGFVRDFDIDSEGVHQIEWCAQQHALGFDAIVGVVKRIGSAAVNPESWYWVTLADHLCLWTLTLHVWMLKRTGMLDYVRFDAESQRMVLKEARRVRRRSSSKESVGPETIPEDIAKSPRQDSDQLLQPLTSPSPSSRLLQPTPRLHVGVASLSPSSQIVPLDGGMMEYQGDEPADRSMFRRATRRRTTMRNPEDEEDYFTVPEELRGSWIDEKMLDKKEGTTDVRLRRFYDNASTDRSATGYLYDGTYVIFTKYSWGPLCPVQRRHRTSKYSWERYEKPEKEDDGDQWKLRLNEIRAGKSSKRFLCKVEGKGNHRRLVLKLEGDDFHVWKLMAVERDDRYKLMEQIHGSWRDVDGDLYGGGHISFNHIGWYPCVHEDTKRAKRSKFELVDIREGGTVCTLRETFTAIKKKTPGKTAHGEEEDAAHAARSRHTAEEKEPEKNRVFRLSVKEGGLIELQEGVEKDGKFEPSDKHDSHELECVLEPIRGRPYFWRRRMDDGAEDGEGAPATPGQPGCCRMSEAAQPYVERPERISEEVDDMRLLTDFHKTMIKQFSELKKSMKQDFEQENSQVLERRRDRHLKKDRSGVSSLMHGHSPHGRKSISFDAGGMSPRRGGSAAGSPSMSLPNGPSRSLPAQKSSESLDEVDQPQGALGSAKALFQELVLKPLKRASGTEGSAGNAKITCLGGAPLKLRARRHCRAVVTCECCGQEINNTDSSKHEVVQCWTCKECDYNVCCHCVNTNAAHAHQVAAERKLIKPGISVYWLQFVSALVMFVVVLLFNSQILNTGEDQNFIDSLVNNQFSSATVLQVFIHLVLLVADRALYNLAYRAMSDRSARWLQVLARYGVYVPSVLWFIAMHTLCIIRAADSPPYRNQLEQHPELYLYYFCYMVYLGASLARVKYGMPAVESDDYKLRPVDPVESQGVYTEKVRYFYFVGQTALPFVDDLRIVIDWSVMPTALDLWMHWKVEDAYNLFFRTRHLMFVRRQSHWAETRDPYEKCYNGWIIVVGIIALLLFPIVLFNDDLNSRLLHALAFDKITSMQVTGTMQLGGMCAANCTTLSLAVFSQIAKVHEPSSVIEMSGHKTQIADWRQDSANPFFINSDAEDLMEKARQGEQLLAVVKFEYTLKRESDPTRDYPYTKTHCFCQGVPGCAADLDLLTNVPTSLKDECTASGVTVTESEVIPTTSTQINANTDSNVSFAEELTLENMWLTEAELTATQWSAVMPGTVKLKLVQLGTYSYWTRLHMEGENEDASTITTNVQVLDSTWQRNTLEESSYGSAVSLYIGVVFIAGKYLRGNFQLSSTRASWEEIPDVDGLLDLISSIKIARGHGDLRTEFQLYYCLMKVLRSPVLLTSIGGNELEGYSFGRSDPPTRGHGPVDV